MLGTLLIVGGTITLAGDAVWCLLKPKRTDEEADKKMDLKKYTDAYNKTFRQLGICKGDAVECLGLEDHECYKTIRFKLAPTLTTKDVQKYTDQLAERAHVDNLEIIADGGEMQLTTYKADLPQIDYRYTRTAADLIPIGVDKNNNIVLWSLKTDPHLLVAGASNSGKSTLVHMIINHIQRGEVGMMWLIDLKAGLEFGDYKHMTHVERYGEDLVEAKNMIQDFAIAAEKRYELIKQKGYKSYQKYYDALNGAADEIGRMFLIIDEFADLMSNKKDPIINDLIMLSRKCRAVGMHIILSTQKPTAEAVPPQMTANITGRIGFRVTNNTNSRTIIDRSGLELLEDRHCIGILGGREVPFRAMYLNDNILLDTIKECSVQPPTQQQEEPQIRIIK